MKILPSYLKIKDNLENFLDFLIIYNKNVEEKYKIEEIHVDVMDGKFVENIGVNIEDIKLIKEKGFLADVHLMVEKPLEEKYINIANALNADSITVHLEIENNLEVIKEIKEKTNAKVGIAINPETNVKLLEKCLKYIDIILVMSVHPGKGGQEFIEDTYTKIKEINEIINEKNILIYVDGGVNEKNAKNLKKLGVDKVICGSYITDNLDISLENRIKKIY